VQIFAASLKDIEKALKTKTYSDPKTKLPAQYHEFLDIFDRKEADRLPPLRGPHVDHRIELIEPDEKGNKVEPPCRYITCLVKNYCCFAKHSWSISIRDSSE